NGKEAVVVTKDSQEKIKELQKGQQEKGILIAENKDVLKANKEDAIAVNEPNKKDAAKPNEEITPEANNKKSILDAIEEQKEALATTKTKKEVPEQRWAV